jgi:hypothetical protein
VLTFGLGAHTSTDGVAIQWPSGQMDKLTNGNTGRAVTVQKGRAERARLQFSAATLPIMFTCVPVPSVFKS